MDSKIAGGVVVSRLTGEQIGKRTKVWGWIGATVAFIVLLVLYMTLMQVDAVQRFSADWPTLFKAILVVPVAVVLFGAMGIASSLSDRRGAVQAAANPTPAALWARAHGWSYCLRTDRCDPELESAVRFSGNVEQTYDLV
ncbi:MAG: hypothetical protein FWF75_10315, partial [Propionibacteriaceae bacterium]|nr:hypothetical protein [Propionibacteriaceae bacterium]